MKVKELIEALNIFNPNMEVAIFHGYNGQGRPRAINFGPQLNIPQDWAMSKEDRIATRARGDLNDYSKPENTRVRRNSTHRWRHFPENDYSDLDTPQGGTIVVISYGHYK